MAIIQKKSDGSNTAKTSEGKVETKGENITQNVIYKSKFWSYIIFAIILGAVFAVTLILCLGFRADYRQLNNQHNEYLEMIDYAKEHPITNLQGEVTDWKLDEETGLYAFCYRVVSKSGASGQLDSNSPYIYTLKEIEEKYALNTEVQVAVKSGILGQDTPSVNMSYADYNIMSYPPFKKSYVGFIIMLIATDVCFFIVCCFLGFAIREKREEIIAKRSEGQIEIVKPNGRRVVG